MIQTGVRQEVLGRRPLVGGDGEEHMLRLDAG